MQEQTTRANPALAHCRGDDDAPSYGAVNVCENCGESCERLTLVPEFEYLGCDDCMVEALAVIAKEAAALVRPLLPVMARLVRTAEKAVA